MTVKYGRGGKDHKTLKTVHDIEQPRSKKINYGRNKESHKYIPHITEQYPGDPNRPQIDYGRDIFTQLNLNLKEYGAELTRDGYLGIEGESHKIEYNLEKNPRNTIRRIVGYIASEGDKVLPKKAKTKEIYDRVSAGIKIDKGLISKLTAALLVFSAASLFPLLSKTSITANAIAISPQTTNIALPICLVAIILIASYKAYKSKK